MILKSYLKTGFRNFVRDKVTSTINVIGLATSVSIGIAVYLMIDKQLRLDEFHPEAKKIYTVQSLITWEGRQETWARTPQLLGQVLKQEFPQVTHTARVQVKSALVRYEDKIFSERLTFADQDYFEIFQFPMAVGSSNLGPKEVIISSRTAQKYFNKEDPIGKTIRVIIKQKLHLFIVKAVAQEFPKTASFGFDFIVSLDHLPTLYQYDLNTWGKVNEESLFTFIKLDDPKSLKVLTSRMDDFTKLVNEANPKWKIEEFGFQELSSIAENSQFTRECYACGSTPQVLIFFALISLILFSSACFNYINIAVASSGKRLKEIAMRKVIGSSRRQIMYQFLVENMVLSFAAVLSGILFAKVIILPGVQTIFGGELLEMNLLSDPRITLFVVVLFLLIGFCSGAYPAWYISSFDPNVIFRGRGKFGRKNSLTKLFLTTQFFLTFFAIVSALIFTQKNEQQKEQDWGYRPDNILVVPVKGSAQYDALDQYIRQSRHIETYCTSGSQIGGSSSNEIAETLEKRISVDAFYVNENFYETMGLELSGGHGFDQNIIADLNQSVVINQKLADVFLVGINDKIKVNDEDYRIVGITHDFHHRDFFEPIRPALFKLSKKEETRYFSMKISPNQLGKVNKDIAAIWDSQFPNELYQSELQANVFDRFFYQSGMLIDVMNFTAVVAILLSSMGLFGLVSLLIVARMKELSIRNVLGCSRGETAKLILKQFNWMIGISVTIGIPVSFQMYNSLLNQIFRGSEINIGITPFIVALFVILSTVFLTVVYHLKKLSNTNPIQNLRTE